MSEYNPSVVRIEKIIKHPNADRLSVATVLGDYPVIFKTGDYNEGDLVGYLPICSIVPSTEQFYFLCPQNKENYEEDGVIKERSVGPKYPVNEVPEQYRIIKAKRLRKIFSQGMLVEAPPGLREGDSIVEYFGLKRWEDDDDFEENISEKKSRWFAKYLYKVKYYNKKLFANILAYCALLSVIEIISFVILRFVFKIDKVVSSLIGFIIANMVGLLSFHLMENFHGKKLGKQETPKSPKNFGIPYYDIEALRKYVGNIDTESNVVISEKIHGSYFSAIYDGKQFYVKSRTRYKNVENEDDDWVSAANRYDLKTKLEKYPMFAFCGELTGGQKNFPYDCEIVNGKFQRKIYFFDIYDTKNNEYLGYEERIRILQDLGLDMVPELYRGLWPGKDDVYAMAEGKTKLGGKHIREGVVVITEACPRNQLKLIGQGYALQK